MGARFYELVASRFPWVERLLSRLLLWTLGSHDFFHRWWQRRRKLLMATIIIVLVAVLLYAGYRFGWTGFRGKTLWDWMQLFVIPIMLAVGGFWLNQIQKRREEEATKQRAEIERREAKQHAQTERDIAADNQREAALQDYINRMSDLLLKEHLGELKPEYEEVRKIARIRTLTVLHRLDGSRKRSVLQFLHESGLLDKSKTIIDLSEANFKEAILTGANLSNADLKKTNLSGANLSNAHLDETVLAEANLEGATLEKTNLREADLTNANLSKAHLYEAILIGTNLSNARLFDTTLTKAYLIGATLQGAYLIGATLQETNLSEADLSNAHLGSVFQEANFRKVSDTLSKYSRVDFKKSDLSNAGLIGLPLYIISALVPDLVPFFASTMEDLSRRGTDLSKADLSNANLYNTDLRGVNLQKANLHGATVTPEQLEQAISLEGATMPDGSKHA